MTAEIGLFLLIVALTAALLQSGYLLPFSPVKRNIATYVVAGAWLQCLAISLAMITLISLRLDNDFSVANVVAHSNLTLPILYKITGAWGNHEGSMLLWVWVLAAYGLALAMSRSHDTEKTLAIAIQSFICAGFLLFIIFTSNPFERQFPPAADGQALNPLLQDIALALHPPLLYLGYVGFSIIFSFAVAALLLKKADRLWAASIHPWILFAWSCLTLGIGLGSWWAYRELGWGGWWFWDPVENASLLPWLCGTALLHANIVLKKRGLLAQWVVLLAIITFALSLLGTFLVRSGVLTSVHGFASDPARGLFILVYMVVLIGGGLLLFALRAGSIDSKEKALPLSREGMIVVNNLFVMSACAAVLLGTIYPLIIEWIDSSKLTVGPAFFNSVFLPLMFVPLLFTAMTPFMAWQSDSLGKALGKMKPAILATLAAIFLCITLIKTDMIFAALGFGLAAWLASASLLYLWRAARRKTLAAVFLGHMGVAILISGITAIGLWKVEIEKNMSVGDTLAIAGYEFTYASESQKREMNYASKIAHFTFAKNNQFIATLTPEYHIYDIRGMQTSEASIYSTLFYDLYAVIGESSSDGKRTSARIYFIPGINIIWLGCLTMALAGVVSIITRRRKTYA